jgi:hypothetical protein
MSLVLQSSGGGSVTIAEPTTASNFTQTLPAADGTVVISGTTPTLNGITFPATQVPSADANTLDDYEEGAWTPVPTATAGSITSYTSTGVYTKVGRIVTCNCLISITNNGTGSTAGNIAGLPFTPASAGTTACTRDYTTTGKMAIWQTLAGATNGAIFAVDGTYPWATGTTFNLSFSYQI